MNEQAAASCELPSLSRTSVAIEPGEQTSLSSDGATPLPGESASNTGSGASNDEATRKHIAKTFGLATGHTLSASFLTIANKWALDYYPHAATLTMLQIVATVLVALSVRWLRIAPVDHLDLLKCWNYLVSSSMLCCFKLSRKSLE